MRVLLSRCLRFISAVGFFSPVIGQATHTVVMGLAGSFYDPPTIAAQEGDIVTFVFGNGIHGVTQSSFEAPCVHLPGGFNSGLIQALNTSEPVQQWSLVVANASQPIWYFCEATRPQSHCNAGMVGVINPPSISMFESYLSAAKTVTGTPTPTPTLILSGIGAYATASPVAPPGAVAPGGTASSSLQTPAPTATSTGTSTSKANIGAIVGGVVGGIAVLAIIAILSYCLYRSNRKQRKRHQDPGLGTTQSEPFRDHIQYAVYPQSPRTPPATGQPHSPDYFGGGPPSTAVRNSVMSAGSTQSPRVNRQQSYMSSTSNPYHDNIQQPMHVLPTVHSQTTQVDMHHLAREVAALMGQQQSQSSGRISPSTDASAPNPSGHYAVANPGEDDSPPRYKS